MNQDIVYPYVQETLKPSKNFEDLMAEWKKIGLPRKCFLELYNSVWSYKKGDEMQTMLFDGKLKNIALTLEEYHHMLSELIKKLRLYSPIRFMMLYEAHYYPKSNLTGIENGMAFQEFLTQGEKASHLVLIDPNPTLVEKLSQFTRGHDIHRLRDRLVLGFTNPLYAEIYQKAEELSAFRVAALDELLFSASDNVICLYLAGMYRKKEEKAELQNLLGKNLERIRKNVVFEPRHKCYVLLPTTFLNKDKTGDGLRKGLMRSFLVEKICLVDSKAAVSVAYTMLSFVKLGIQNKESTSENIQRRSIVLQSVQLVEGMELDHVATSDTYDRVTAEERLTGEVVREGSILRLRKEYAIPASVLFSNKLTLSKLYAEAEREKRSRGLRKSSEPYPVSTEIKFNYSGKENSDGSIKPRIIYQGLVDRIKTRNYLDEKAKLHYVERGKNYVSKSEMLQHIEALVIENEELSRIIKQSIANLPLGQSISLKTFCIMHYKFFASKNKNVAVFKKVFSAVNSAEYPICKIMLGISTMEDIQKAVSETAKLLSLSEQEQDVLWHQVYILFSMAQERCYVEENPVINIIDQLDRQQKQENFFKKNMTEKILSDDQEYKIVNAALNNNAKPGLALGLLIKIFTGLSYQEISALLWEDYFRLVNHDCMILNIDKRLVDKKSGLIPYLAKLKIRTVPVSSFLVPLLDAWHESSIVEYRKLGINSKDQRKLPIIHSDKNPTDPISPSRLRYFGNKYLNEFGPEGLKLQLAAEAGKKEFDTGKYGGDFYRENFRDQSLTVAGLEEGELCYMLGIASHSGTMENFYYGYDKPSRLVRIRDKIDVWAAKRMPELSNVGYCRERFVLSSETTLFRLNPANKPMETTYRMFIERDTPNIEFEIYNRLGFAVTFRWEEGDE